MFLIQLKCNLKCIKIVESKVICCMMIQPKSFQTELTATSSTTTTTTASTITTRGLLFLQPQIPPTQLQRPDSSSAFETDTGPRSRNCGGAKLVSRPTLNPYSNPKPHSAARTVKLEPGLFHSRRPLHPPHSPQHQ